MSRSVVGITLDNLHELPAKCRRCVFWELAPHLREEAEELGQTEFEKEAWVSSVLLEWGSCGRIAHVEGVPAGFVLYAPPSAVPRTAMFPSGPVSPDAVLLTTVKVLPEFAGNGLGRMLAQAVVRDLTRRGVKAVEAFGNALPDNQAGCVVPADFLRSVGFKTVRPHPRWPRLRLELRSAFSWQADVEAALERLLDSVTVTTAGVGPAGVDAGSAGR
ncbi:GNAT family N-acetyltransferase [Actinoalloteichus spitiensis]|uniref:GNAT family N-acetyltransferase n=1 Tax=Actinoalloteichus spitiensis TaxID=252394 RepID=UPI0004746239|nr:GNAT family N-acetyltransferase [Actinoalloteichus spitiensis]